MDHLSLDDAHHRVYRWGEDGLGGICDRLQTICFAFAFWNGKDPILKERFFGLSNLEGNHGESVKEHYHYLDATPTSSYLKMLYKYPQQEFPYAKLREESRKRGLADPEYQLRDTGIFEQNRYFNLIIEHAKEGPKDILCRVTIVNRGLKPSAHLPADSLVSQYLELGLRNREAPPLSRRKWDQIRSPDARLLLFLCRWHRRLPLLR